MSLYKRIKELSERATPGPWKDIDHDPGEVIVYGKDNSRVAKVPKFTGIGLINAELIVTLLNNLPSVLSALKGQEWLPISELRELKGETRIVLGKAGSAPYMADIMPDGKWRPDVLVPCEFTHFFVLPPLPTPPEGVSL